MRMFLKNVMTGELQKVVTYNDAPMKTKLGKRTKIDNNYLYVPVDIIDGFLEDFESLWSPSKYVLTDQRGR